MIELATPSAVTVGTLAVITLDVAEAAPASTVTGTLLTMPFTVAEIAAVPLASPVTTTVSLVPAEMEAIKASLVAQVTTGLAMVAPSTLVATAVSTCVRVAPEMVTGDGLTVSAIALLVTRSVAVAETATAPAVVVLAVMITVPVSIAAAVPVASMLTVSGLFDDHATSVVAAPAITTPREFFTVGVYDSVRVRAVSVSFVRLSVIDAGSLRTVTTKRLMRSVSDTLSADGLAAVIVADPRATPLTCPTVANEVSATTDATAGSLELQVTALRVSALPDASLNWMRGRKTSAIAVTVVSGVSTRTVSAALFTVTVAKSVTPSVSAD